MAVTLPTVSERLAVLRKCGAPQHVLDAVAAEGNLPIEGEYQEARGGWVCLGAGCPGCSTCDGFRPL